MNFKKYHTVAKCIVSVILITLLVRSVSWPEVWALLQRVNVVFVLLFVLLYLVGLLCSARKWQILAEQKKFSEGYTFYIKTYLIGTFLNNFFPSFVGGDTYRALALAKKGRTQNALKRASQTVIADRITGLHVVLLLGVFFSVTIILSEQLTSSMTFIFLVMWASALGLSLLLRFFDHPLFAWFFAIFPRKVEKYISDFNSFRDKKLSLQVYSYSAAFAIIGIAIENYMLFLAVGSTLTLWEYLSVIFIISVVASVPLSIGNIGVKEWAYIFFFGLFGVSTTVAVTVVILSRFLQMLISFTAVPLYLAERNKH